MGSLETLPPEIHEMILDLCNHSSYKALRLTSKPLQTLATPRVFDTVYLGLFDHSIAALNAIAGSHLACIPRKLIFCGAWMRALTFSEWKTHVDISAARYYEKTGEFDIDARMPDYAHCRKWTSDRVKFGGLSDEQLMVYWRRYYEFAQQQRKWAKLIMESDILAGPLAKMTGLRSMSVPNEAPMTSRKMPEVLWLNLWTKTLVLIGWDPCFHSKDNCVALHGLLQSLVRREPAIKLDQVDITIHARKMWDYLANRRHLGSPALYRRPFEHVKNLSLKIEIDVGDEVVVRTATLEIAHWIAACGVERLKLRVHNPQHGACRLLHLIPSTALQKLRELYLEVENSEEELSTFLRQRGAKLKGLTIGYSLLLDSTWTRTLQLLPTWLPELQSFDLRGPLHSRSGGLHWIDGLANLVDCETWYRQYQGYVLRMNDCPSLNPDEWEQQRLAMAGGQGLLESVSFQSQGEHASVDEDGLGSNSTLSSDGGSSSVTGSSDISSYSSESDGNEDWDSDLDEFSDAEESDSYASIFNSDNGFSTETEDWFDEDHVVTTSSNASAGVD